MRDFDFSGKVVVVTGAGGGLGRVYALEFAKRGASVLVNDFGTSKDGTNPERTRANFVTAEIRFHGGIAEANSDSVLFGEKIIDAAIKYFGRIDVIVNNAGILRDKSFQKMTENDWDMVFETHVKGAFSVTKAAWLYFKKQRYGRIIFTSSNSAIYGNFGQANYAAAKSALIGFSHTLALEGINYNIHSNVLVPTATSRLNQALIPGELAEGLKPEYVAPLVMYLGHDSCKETGKIFEAGAGWYGQIQAYRSQGIVLQDPSVEEVIKNWEAITDMSSAKHHESIQEVTAELISCRKPTESMITVDQSRLEKKYCHILQEIGISLNARYHRDCFSYTFLITHGDEVLTNWCYVSSDHTKTPPTCVFTVDTDLLDQILCGQLVAKEAIERTKLTVVGDGNAEELVECMNDLARKRRSKL